MDKPAFLGNREEKRRRGRVYESTKLFHIFLVKPAPTPIYAGKTRPFQDLLTSSKDSDPKGLGIQP